MLSVIGYSVAIGWVFATSETLRIGRVQDKFATGNRIAWSGGMFGCALMSVLWLHSYLLPQVFPKNPPEASLPGFWIIPAMAAAFHLMLLFGGRQVAIWWVRTRPEILASEPLPELDDGE